MSEYYLKRKQFKNNKVYIPVRVQFFWHITTVHLLESTMFVGHRKNSLQYWLPHYNFFTLF